MSRVGAGFERLEISATASLPLRLVLVIWKSTALCSCHHASALPSWTLTLWNCKPGLRATLGSCRLGRGRRLL